MARLRPLEFDDYFRTQYPVLVNELDFIVGDRALARDIAQDAFIRQYVSWARLSHFDKPGAWVRKVAIRLAGKFLRRRQGVVSLDAAMDLSSPAIDVDQVLDVRRAIAQLTPQQRSAVVLHYYRDLPVAEVASALGCKESTAKVHLFQARQRLAELLVQYKEH